jgi:hypothetical protein
MTPGTAGLRRTRGPFFLAMRSGAAQLCCRRHAEGGPKRSALWFPSSAPPEAAIHRRVSDMCPAGPRCRAPGGSGAFSASAARRVVPAPLDPKKDHAA